MKNLTLISASFNTPLITKNMLLTFRKFHKDAKILICENSKDDETKNILNEAKIPFIISENKKHSPSIDKLIYAIDTDYALIVDTDIIFLKPIHELFDVFVEKNITSMGCINVDDGKFYEPRIHPCFNLINVSHIKKEKIRYFDPKRDQNKIPSRLYKNYDVGSSFLEDIKNAKLKIADVDGHKYYYFHYGDMSWGYQNYDPSIPNQNNFDIGSHGFEHIYQNSRSKLEKYIQENNSINDMKIDPYI